MIQFIAILVTFSIFCHGWNNEFDKELNFTCPHNLTVSGIRSEHSDATEDRLFDIQCRLTAGARSRCHWSGWVNQFDEFFSYECNQHGFIDGMRSIHDNAFEDRRWEFYCCERSGYTVSECYQTHHTDWDAYFSMDVPENFVLRGVTSVHNNQREDRQYVFELCKLRPV